MIEPALCKRHREGHGNLSMAIERLGRRNSMANGQFSMTNSQSTLASSAASPNGLAPKVISTY
jgi:hypothetical protein